MKKKKYNLAKYYRKYAGLVLPISIIIVLLSITQIESLRSKHQLEKEMPSEIVSLANKAGMSSEGKYLFYSSRPQIVGPNNYLQLCYEEGEHAGEGLTRGCTKTTSPFGITLETKIYLRLLDNPEYADAMVDTAAHEMLHVAYDQLSKRERSSLDTLLDQEVRRHRDDPRISLYTEGGDKLSIISSEEFHSVLGSYYRDVSPELEDHFKKYFSNRDALLKIGESSLLRSRLDKAAEYRNQGKIYERKMNAINEKLFPYRNGISNAERIGLESQLRELGKLYVDAVHKHDQVTELLE